MHRGIWQRFDRSPGRTCQRGLLLLFAQTAVIINHMTSNKLIYGFIA